MMKREVRFQILFQIRSGRNGSHFTALRILRILSDGRSATAPAYISASMLREYFLATFDMLEDYEENLNILLRYGLVEANNRLDEYSEFVDEVRVSNFGIYMARELVFYFAYLDLICVDCAIFDESFAHYLADAANEDFRLYRNYERVERVNQRLNRVQGFLSYLEKEEDRESSIYDFVVSENRFSYRALKIFAEERPRILRSARNSASKQ